MLIVPFPQSQPKNLQNLPNIQISCPTELWRWLTKSIPYSINYLEELLAHHWGLLSVSYYYKAFTYAVPATWAPFPPSHVLCPQVWQTLLICSWWSWLSMINESFSTWQLYSKIQVFCGLSSRPRGHAWHSAGLLVSFGHPDNPMKPSWPLSCQRNWRLERSNSLLFNPKTRYAICKSLIAELDFLLY
jgi:hypothetical protein